MIRALKQPGVTTLRRRSVLTAWLTGVMVVALSATALFVGRASLAAAEQERLDERTRLVQRIAAYTASTFDPEILKRSVARTPFQGAKKDPELAARLLQQFRTAATADPTALAALVLKDGTVVAVNSEGGAAPPLAEIRDSLATALDGDATRSHVFDFQGRPSWATVAPVGALVPWGAVVVVQNGGLTSSQLFVRNLGSLGTGSGGISWSDATGRALISWDPAEVGGQVTTPAEIAGWPQEQATVTRTGRGDAEVITVAMRSTHGSAVMFRQPTGEMFADLIVQQRQRDVTLLGVIAIVVLGLVVASILRVRTARRNRTRQEKLLRNSQDLILVTEPDGTLKYVSPAIGPLLDHDRADWKGRPLDELFHTDDVAAIHRLVADPTGIRRQLDVRLISGTGETRWFDVEAGDVSENPELRGILLTCHEVGERKSLQDELLHQARHDALTGLPNRLVLNTRLREALAAPGADADAGPAVLFVDLDRFKAVNDTYGHAAGDTVLHTVAERLTSSVRDGDLVCRFGGDEFGIVLPTSGEAVAARVAERIVHLLGEPISIGGPDVEIGASVGVAVRQPGLQDADPLLRAADAAMYRAKQGGRGRWVVHRADGEGAGGTSSALAVAAVVVPGHDLVPYPDAADATDTSAPVLPGGTDPGTDADAGDGGDVSVPAGPPAAAERPHAPAGDSRAARGRMIATLTPLLAAALAILAIAGLGAWQTAQARHAAERQRMDERLQMTQRVAEYADVLGNPQRLLKPVNAAPWRLDGRDSLVDGFVLRAVLASDLGGEGSQAALLTTRGEVLVSSQAAPPAGIRPGDAAWRAAISGRVGYVPLVEEDGVLYGYYAIPVLRDGRPGAVLVVAQVLRYSVAQRMLEVLGSLGFGDGGVSSVEVTGRATHSWNPALIGAQIVDRGQLAGLTGASVVRGPADAVTLAAPIASTKDTDKKVIVFRQPVSAFYGDLRSGQGLRDGILLLAVIAAIGVLAGSSWQRERNVRRVARRLDALLRHSHDIVAVFSEGRARFISSAMTGLLGHDPREWLGRSVGALVHPQDARRLDDYMGRRSDGALHDVRLLHADGGYRWFDVHSADLRADPVVRGFVVTCHEVSERKQLQDELSYRACHDALTDLPNRTVFAEQLAVLEGDTGSGFTVLFVDLDRFKPVNDTFGHDAGDAVLRSVARRLREVVPTERAVCRLGGDEFAVLLGGVDETVACRIADQLLQRIREPIALPGERGGAVQIDATIGIAHSGGVESAEAVVRRADEAMYEAKEAGRGRYAIYAA